MSALQQAVRAPLVIQSGLGELAERLEAFEAPGSERCARLRLEATLKLSARERTLGRAQRLRQELLQLLAAVAGGEEPSVEELIERVSDLADEAGELGAMAEAAEAWAKAEQACAVAVEVELRIVRDRVQGLARRGGSL